MFPLLPALLAKQNYKKNPTMRKGIAQNLYLNANPCIPSSSSWSQSLSIQEKTTYFLPLFSDIMNIDFVWSCSFVIKKNKVNLFQVFQKVALRKEKKPWSLNKFPCSLKHQTLLSDLQGSGKGETMLLGYRSVASCLFLTLSLLIQKPQTTQKLKCIA